MNGFKGKPTERNGAWVRCLLVFQKIMNLKIYGFKELLFISIVCCKMIRWWKEFFAQDNMFFK